MTLAREPKQCFLCSLEGGILEGTSGRMHLGGIWEDFGSSLGALWGLSGNWGGHGSFKDILDRKCCQFIVFFQQK